MTRGLIWSLVAAGCSVVGNLVVTPTLVHTLGPAVFGVYLLVLAFAGYAGFLDLGLTWASGRYFAADLGAGDRMGLTTRFHTLLRFLAGVGGISVLLAVVVGRPLLRWAGVPISAGESSVLGLAGLAFALNLQVGLLGALLRACQRFDEAGRVAVAGAVLPPVASWAAVRISGTVFSLLFGVTLVNAALLILAWTLARSSLLRGPAVAGWDARRLREMVAFGGWSSLGRLVMVVMLQVDRLVVALVGAPLALTYYAVPATLATRVNTVGGPMAGLFFSRAGLLHARGRIEALAHEHARATRLLAWTTTAAVIPPVALGTAFLRVWIGPEMAAAGGPVLIAMALGYAVTAVASLDAVTLEAAGRADLTAKTMGAWALVAVVGAMAGTPTLGPLAIALGVGGWLAAVGVTSMVLARRLVLHDHRPGGELGLLLGVGIASLASGGAGVLIRPWVDSVLAGLLAFGVTGVTALVVGALTVLTREDRRYLAGKARPTLTAVFDTDWIHEW